MVMKTVAEQKEAEQAVEPEGVLVRPAGRKVGVAYGGDRSRRWWWQWRSNM